MSTHQSLPIDRYPHPNDDVDSSRFSDSTGVDGRALVGYAFGLGAVGMYVFRYYTDIYKKKKW